MHKGMIMAVDGSTASYYSNRPRYIHHKSSSVLLPRSIYSTDEAELHDSAP